MTNPDGKVRTCILTYTAFHTIFRVNLLYNTGTFGISARGYLQYIFRAVDDADTAPFADRFLYTDTHITLQSFEGCSLFRGMSLL